MPIYEYKGQQYDIATEDQGAAKAKILSYLEKQGGAPESAPPPITSTAAQNRADAQARQDVASRGPEQISTPQAELADAERNVAALTRELRRKGVDAGPRPAIGSTKAGDFLLAQGAKAQGQQPADVVAPPAPPPAPALAPPAPRAVDDRVRRTPSLYDVQPTPPKLDNTVAGTQAALNMAGVSPQYVASLKAEYNQLDPAKRVVALQQAIDANPPNTVKGRAIRAVAADDAAWSTAISKTPAARLLSPRLEDVMANIKARYPERPDELIMQDAQRAMARGQSDIDYGSMQRDVVGEQAAAAAEQQAKELKDAGMTKRVGAGALSGAKKSLAGLTQFGADLWGDKAFSQELANTQRIEGAKSAAIPQGEGIFEKSFQGAATSLASQAPFMALSALTGSSVPILAQAALQQFGDSYGEGKAAGLSTTQASLRAAPMAAAEVFFERFGMTKAMAGLKSFVAEHGGANIAKYVAKAIAEEIPSELATTASQYVTDVLPGIGMNKNPSLIDLYNQLEETLRQTVLQAGVTGGVTIAGVKGVQGAKATPQAIDAAKERLRETSNKIVGIEKTNELLGPREGAYERPGEISRAKLMAEMRRVPFASSSGTLNVPPAEKAAAEPGLGNLENVGMREEEEPGLRSLENVQVGNEPSFGKGEAAPPAEDTEAKVNAIAERLRSRGIPRENALRIAQRQVAEEQAKGAKDVAGTEPPPSGESTSVASEPGAKTPGGLETPARDGVVPVEPNAGVSDAGKAPEPAALKETALTGTEKPTPIVQSSSIGNMAPEYLTEIIAPAREAIQAGNFKPVTLKDGRQVNLVVSQDKENLGGRVIAFDQKGQEVGQLEFSKDTDEKGNGYNPHAFVDEEFRRQGLATALYDLAEASGAKIPSLEQQGQIRSKEGQALREARAGKKTPAPVAKAPKPAKPAKPGKEVHTTPQNAEGKWSHAVNGEVVGTYDTKRQATAAMLLAKAKKTGNEELIAQRQKVFDEAMNPQQRGRPPKVIPFEAPAEEAKPEVPKAEETKAETPKVEEAAPTEVAPAIETKAKTEAAAKAKTEAAAEAKAKAEKNLTLEEKERLEELDDLHTNATNNPNTEGGKVAKKTLERITKDFDEPKVVRERAKAMLAGEYSTLAIQAAQGKKDLAFSKFTTSSQTLSHIIKTGTDFQKRLARRLRSTVRNVKMVVVEKGQELPASVAAVKAKWDRALAMYNTEEKVVYTKGESYGKTNGLNAVVQLHELFHGATSQKIRTALAYTKMGRHLDSQMVEAVKGLQRTMDAARAELNKQIEAGTVDPDVHGLAVYGEAFTNLHEFVSYGNTDAKLQEFLKGVQGFEKDEGLFSPFVDGLRRLIGIAKEDANALSDLVQHTDQLISSRRPGGWGFPEVETLASAAIPPSPGGKTQAEMDADDNAAWGKVDASQKGQGRAAALKSLMALRDPRVIWARLEGVWDKLDNPTRKAIALTFDRNGIASTIGKHIPALHEIADRLQRMDGMAASIRAGAAQQAGMVVNFARKDREAMKVLDRLIPASTLARYDPANPPASGVRAVKTDEAYAALKPAGQRVYRELRDYFADMHNTARDIMEASVDALDLPADAKQKLMTSIRLAFEEGKIEPYFPLMRSGDYIFRIKQRGADDYESYRFPTKAERNFAAEAYAKEQGAALEDLDVQLTKDRGGKEQRGIVEGNSKLLKEMYEAIDSMDTADSNAKAKLKDNMYQVYLDLMPEASVRKQFIHREEVVGFNTDTLGMINTQGIKIASALSKLQYGNELRNLSEQANRQLEGKEQYEDFVGTMDAIIDEALNPQPLGRVAGFFDPVTKQWTKFTFYHNLTSLSSALMQPADIFLTGTPVLVGNHGPKALVELTKMAQITKQYGVWETLPDGTERFRAPSIAYAKGLPEIELKAIADMVGEHGLSTDTLANEIFDAATKPVNKADPKAIELAKDAGKLLVLGGLMHHAERLSREVLGLASFRLYYAEMEKASPGNPANYAKAVRSAVAEVNEALGDYSPGNRPQIMRGPIGKLTSTYKFFPLTRIKLLGGNFFRMIPFLNKEGKIAAATKFFGILGTHGLLTGVVGLPMYGIIQALWGQWQKDDDAPQTMKDLDHDTWWRTEYLRNELGDGEVAKLLGEIAKGGIANYATGMAISERLGLNDMVFRTPDPGKNLKESVANYAEAFFGAQLAPIKAVQDSWDYYSQGEYQKAFEALPFMPKSIAALSATERISREGIETKKGIPVLDNGEVTTKELIGQALGFQSARVAEAQRIAHATDIIERGISAEKQAIVGKASTMLLKAINPNRSPEQRERFLNMYLETIQKVPKFNVKYPEHGIDGKEIDAKIDAELEQIALSKVFGGVKINDNNIRLFIQAALASREALNNPK